MKETTHLYQLERTVFYALDKAIKSYRQFGQRNIRSKGLDLTIDQWLVLKTIRDHPDLSQREMAQRVFKDYASITRIIELLVKRDYLVREPHPEDRRRYRLALTPAGNQIYDQLVPIIETNRQIALTGLSDQDIQQLKALLSRITDNCSD